MRRIQIQKTRRTTAREDPVLPLDPRDPCVVRAKSLANKRELHERKEQR
jgi:hypothetical protein